MSETVILWLILPFGVYLVHPIFMGMVISSRLRRWWQVALLAAGVALFNLPKLIWGVYSTPADIFRLLSAPVILVAIPVLFFTRPVWKRLLVNLLLFSGQFVGEALAVFLLGDLSQIRDTNVVVSTFPQGAVYTVVGLLGIILVDSGVVILARTMQARRFSIVYLPVIFILASLFGNFYAYISASSVLFWCVCILLSAVSIVCLLYYVVSLEKKAELEKELQDIHYTMELEQAHYRTMQERREELARIRHDFNNQLAAVSLLIQSGEENDAQSMLRQLGENIAATREEPYCSVPVINAVLTEKTAMCEREGIRLEVQLDLPDTLTMDPLHLCSIFANLLDNAAKAAKFTAEPTITLSSAVAGDYLFIKTVNPSLPQKNPGKGHGYGSKILKQLAAKYDGSYQTSYEDGVFTAVVTLLLEQPTN